MRFADVIEMCTEVAGRLRRCAQLLCNAARRTVPEGPVMCNANPHRDTFKIITVPLPAQLCSVTCR